MLTNSTKIFCKSYFLSVESVLITFLLYYVRIGQTNAADVSSERTCETFLCRNALMQRKIHVGSLRNEKTVITCAIQSIDL